MTSCVFKLLMLLQLLTMLIQHIDAGSIIRYLPGFDGPLPFKLETGYIGVGEAEENQYFYYFIKSDSNPKEDPFLVWLSGGPACSSFSGLVHENGPLAFKVETYNGTIPTLVSTTYSWTKVANIIYLDQPIGGGFSYSTNPLADFPNDTESVKLVEEFVRKWLAQHPEYSSNPFYVGGNSYSGKTVPAIVQEISNGNCICRKPQINIQGSVVGNARTDPYIEDNGRIPYAYGMGLISGELYGSMKDACGGKYINVDPLNKECLKLVKDYTETVSRVDIEYIQSPPCEDTSPDCYRYRYLLSEYWANEESVREALHVVKGTPEKWERCNFSVKVKEDIASSVPYHIKNSNEGFRSLVFNGELDLGIPFTATRDWIRYLNYPIVDKWRPWMVHDQIAGYTQTYANKMTFATVKGGGHTLDFKPEESSIMFQRWISGKPL